MNARRDETIMHSFEFYHCKSINVIEGERGGGHDEYLGHLLTCRLITANRGPALPCVCAHDTKNVMSVSYPI